MKLKILGGGGEVGRAAYVIEERNVKILLDYGVNFDERDNPQLPLHVRPVDLSGLIISHAHLDHVGAAPYLFITGEVKAFATRPTLEIARYLILDFLKLNTPFIEYELRDFEKMFAATEFLKYGEFYDNDSFRIEFYNAGHILGSTASVIELPSGHRVLYTGDINNLETWTLNGAQLPDTRVDTVIIESTYGARNHPPRKSVEDQLLKIVEETVDRGGTVLIPAFSVGRGQEILAMLASQAPYLDIYIDGMVKDVTEVYLMHSSFLKDPVLFKRAIESVNFVTGHRDRRKIINKPCVIIASAGMLKGGPSVYYLKKIADNSRNTIVLVSYQAPNSGGHELLETGSLTSHEVKDVKARVFWLDFSSHAGKRGLIELVSKYKSTVRNIILVHGSKEEAAILAEGIRDALGADVNVYIPSNGEEITLNV